MSSLNELDFNEAGEWPLVTKISFIASVCCLFWVAGYFFLVKDKLYMLDTRQKEEVSLKQTFVIKRAKAVNLEAYKAQMLEMETNFSSMLQQLPSKSDVADLLSDISRTGKVHGLEFELFKPQSEQPQNFYAELPIQMQVTGSYHQFGGFISSVAALPRIVTLHDFQIKPASAPNNSENINLTAGTLSMHITAKTYRYLDESEIILVQDEKGATP